MGDANRVLVRKAVGYPYVDAISLTISVPFKNEGQGAEAGNGTAGDRLVKNSWRR